MIFLHYAAPAALQAAVAGLMLVVLVPAFGWPLGSLLSTALSGVLLSMLFED